MDKSKFFTAVITIGVSATILYIIIHFTFSNKINKGDFRVSDAVLSSVVELQDESEGASEWKYDISQNNKISMLVQAIGDASVKEVYLENVRIKSRNDVNIYIEQPDYKVSYEYSEVRNKKVNIYVEENEKGDYIIEFDVKNKNVIDNYTIPGEVKELRHDGTIFNITKTPISKLQFKIKYSLVILQENQRVNTCKIEIQMPDEKIITEGFFVKRLDSTNYDFRVSY